MTHRDAGDDLADAITRYAESVRDLAGDGSVADMLSPPIDVDAFTARVERMANEEFSLLFTGLPLVQLEDPEARHRFFANAEHSEG